MACECVVSVNARIEPEGPAPISIAVWAYAVTYGWGAAWDLTRGRAVDAYVIGGEVQVSGFRGTTAGSPCLTGLPEPPARGHQSWKAATSAPCGPAATGLTW